MKIKIIQSMYVIIIVSILVGTALAPVVSCRKWDNTTGISYISVDEAAIVAVTILGDLTIEQFNLANYEILSDEKGMVLCYAFLLNPTGYVVISAHDSLPPVLAYSLTGTFSLEGPILREILQADIALRLHHINDIPIETIEANQKLWDIYLSKETNLSTKEMFRQWPAQGATRSGGWLETTWHQNAPFNNMVPIDLNSGARSVAGCPAVTMAQICNFHQTINGVAFNDSDDYYHSYAGNNFWIDDDHVLYDFPSYPELNIFLDDLSNHWGQGVDLSENDKAALTFACGIAAEQVYHPQGSGTYGVNQAYAAYQRFNFSGVDLLDENDPDVYERIQENIKEGLPVHLAVVNEDWTIGHNLVIDGYNTDDYYHLNFGWGGSYDGWYKLPEELPFELTFLEGVVVDITDDNAISNLQGYGNLYWPNTRPGVNVIDSFSIQNVGDLGSSINWEIVSWPEWGSWTFSPENGNGLTPEGGAVTIDVSLNVPDEKKMNFKGTIRIENTDNQSDYCLIHVLVSTPQTSKTPSLIQHFIQQHPYFFQAVFKIFSLLD